MIKRIPPLICAVVLLGTGLNARDPGHRRGPRDTPGVRSAIAGPYVGFVVGRETGARLVRGVLGAASLTDALDVIPGLRVWTSVPRHGYLIGLRAEDDRLVVLPDLRNGAEPIELDLLGGDLIVTSPSGAVAAVLDQGRGVISVLRGLPRDPAVAWTASLAGLPQSVSALAISDDAEGLLAATGNSLMTASRDAAWQYLAAVEGAVAVQYLAGSRDVVYADAGAKQVFHVRATDAGSQFLLRAAEPDGVTAPVAVATSADNRWLHIANADPPGILSVNLADGLISSIECPRTPTHLNPMASEGVFQLTDADAGTILLLDGTRTEPRLSFIPNTATGGAK